MKLIPVSYTHLLTLAERVIYAKEQVVSTFSKVFPYIIAGVGIGTLIHNWIPQSFVEGVLGRKNPLGVIFATLIGVPMYADIFGTIPVAEALLHKGADVYKRQPIHCVNFSKVRPLRT